jgi:hypothetical protein
MRTISAAAFLSCLLAATLPLFPQGVIPAGNGPGDERQRLPAGIACCDEQKIRQAMTEEALLRIAARHEGGAGAASDYLSDQAHEKIRRRLPAGSREQRMDFLRAALKPPAADEDTREFQELVGYFVLGMTLEIGLTFQDEYDQAQASSEKVGVLLAELEKAREIGDEELGRALFRADLSEKELRRLRALERRWKEAAADSPPFAAFNQLKGNVTGRAPDPDQQTAFGLALRYRAPFPFLDEFLEKYRRVALEFRETVRRINVLLSASGS